MLADVPAWSRQGLTGGAEVVQKGNCYFAHTWVLVTEKCNGRFSIKIIDFLQFPAEKWDLTDKQTCAKEIGFSPCLHPSPSKKKKKKNHQNENIDKLDFLLSRRKQNPELFSWEERDFDMLPCFIPRTPKRLISYLLPLTFRLAETLAKHCAWAGKGSGNGVLNITVKHQEKKKKRKKTPKWLRLSIFCLSCL